MKTVKGVYHGKDQRRLHAEISHRDPALGLLWLVGCSTGFRVSDLLNLRVGGLTENGLFCVRETKTGKLRQVILPKSIYGALNAQIRALKLGPTDYVFGGPKPITRQRAHKVFREAGAAVGLPGIGTHSMRKTYAWSVLLKSRSFEAVQAALLHAFMSTTFAYLADGLLSILPKGNRQGIPPASLQTGSE